MGKLGQLLLGLGSIVNGLETVGTMFGIAEPVRPGPFDDPEDERQRIDAAKQLPAPRSGRSRPADRQIFPASSASGRLFNVGDDIGDRIRHIIGLIKKGRRDPKVIEFASRAVSQQCGTNSDGSTRWCTTERDYQAEAEAVFRALKNRLRYVYDPRGTDLYKGAARTIEWRAGDCDCSVVALNSALEAVGHSTALALAHIKGGDAGYNHIWTLDGMPPRKPESWYPLDASVNRGPGWQATAEMIQGRIKIVRVPE